MSARVQSPHLRRDRILAALVFSRGGAVSRAAVIKAARVYLRGQGIRASVEEIVAALGMTLAELLFPPCDCMFLDDTATSAEIDERRTPGPHHVGGCPAWRPSREAQPGGAA